MDAGYARLEKKQPSVSSICFLLRSFVRRRTATTSTTFVWSSTIFCFVVWGIQLASWTSSESHTHQVTSQRERGQTSKLGSSADELSKKKLEPRKSAVFIEQEAAPKIDANVGDFRRVKDTAARGGRGYGSRESTTYGWTKCSKR